MTAMTRALSAALLHFVWQGLAVTIVLWLALWVLRRRSAALRYLASCAALALLVALPALTTWILYDHPAPVAAIAAAASFAAPSIVPLAPAPAPVDWIARLQTWAVPVWSCGVLLFSIRMLWGCTQIAGLRRRGAGCDEGLLLVVAALARRMGVARPVRVLLSHVTDSPSVTGWLRPIILLPISAVSGLTPDQLEAVLAHELAHIRRHDYLVNLFQMAAETLLFYHPAVWWISSRIRQERELCCDDLAVAACGGAMCYARALTALEKMRAARPALALGSTDGPLFLRIRRLLTGGGEYGPSKLSGLVAISLGIVCMALCVNWAHGQEPVRGVAIIAESVEDGPGVTVDIGGAAVIHRTGVEYPQALLAKRIEGTVSVEAILDATGDVVDAHVLSGPEELRKRALTSVLDWHFVPGSGNTRVVRITFRPADIPVVPEPERKKAERKNVQGWTVASSRGGPEVELITRSRSAQTTQFLEEELLKARDQLSAGESRTPPDEETVARLRKKLAELEQKLAVAQKLDTETRSNVELTFRVFDETRRNSERAGQKLAAIEIRGMSDQAGNDLLARLPVHEGDTLTNESLEASGRTIREFDAHLEFNYGREPEGTVLRIHPAGAAGAPLIRRK